MNKNAPYIREIIERTSDVSGVRIVGESADERRQHALAVLNQQLKQSKEQRDARKKTH